MKAQDNKQQGRIDEKRYQEFLAKFQVDLEAAMSLVNPTPANIALYARILSRMGDSGRALAALGPALDHDPASPVLRVTLGQVHYDRKDYPAALAEANAVLELDPANKEALALKHFSEGRLDPGAAKSALAQGIRGGARAEQFRAPLTKDSPKVQALVPRIRAARNGGDMRTAMSLTQKLMRAEPASEYTQEIYRIVAKDYARWQRVQATIGNINSAKAALLAGRGDEALAWANNAVQTDPAPEVMKFAEEVRGIVGDGKIRETPQKSKPSSPKDGGIPLWPILPISGLGAAAFVVAKSRKTVESEDGFDGENRPVYGRLQQFVAGAVLAGLAGAGIYLAGATVIPVAVRYLAVPSQHAIRLAQSEAGAINPRSAAASKVGAQQANAAAQEATEVVRQVVIKKGEILNRVWDSRWTKEPPGAGFSGPTGASFCRGNCMPINSGSAITQRGLNIPGVSNNAGNAGTFRATEDIVVSVRQSIGGAAEEIVVSRPDISKLRMIEQASLPPGTAK